MRCDRSVFPVRALISGLLAAALLGCGDSGGGGGGGGNADGAPGPGGGSTITGAADGSSGGTSSGGGALLDCAGHGCGVKQLALGTIAACALLEDGTVACYGGGIVGTLGRGDRPMIDPVPARVPNLRNVAKIFGGGYSMCAVLADRTVTCWGPDQSANPYGARPGDRFVVEGLANVVELSVATSHTCALVDGGDVYCFGSNYFGELGDGTTDNTKKAVKTARISGVKQIATGAEVTCAVLADGGASCWGMNDMGQLGQGNVDKLVHSVPVAVAGLAGPVQTIDASSEAGAVCALLESGATKCWGEKLGESTGAATPGATALSVGWKHACVIDDGGAVSCFGSNTKGQLGTTSTAPSVDAVAASGIHGATSLAVGGSSSCAVFSDGSFSCWGDDTRGQLGGGHIATSSPTPKRRHF